MNEQTKRGSVEKSIWWGLCASFWYWWDFGVPLFFARDTAFWHGFHLRSVYNTEYVNDPDILNDTARDAVSTDVSYWEP